MPRLSAFPVVIVVLAVALAILVFNHGGSIAGLDDDDFASLVYGGVWVSVLGAGLVFAFRGRMGEAFRGALLWAAAFAVLVGVYAYRADFQAVGDRMLSALLPGRAVAVAGSDGRQVRVTRAGDDHFHIDADVNGTTVPFLVDTGASAIALDRAAARRIGLDPDGLDYSIPVQTANGVTRAAPVTLDVVRVAGIERRNVRALVTEGEGFGLSLLGMSFLGSLSSFDFRGDQLVLTD